MSLRLYQFFRLKFECMGVCEDCKFAHSVQLRIRIWEEVGGSDSNLS